MNQKGVPFAYDDEGSILTPDKRAFTLSKNKRRKGQKMTHLSYTTIDFDSNQIMETKYKSVTGRKKGFIHQLYCKIVTM